MVETYTARRCTCGHRACRNWFVYPVADVQGVCFTEEQAKAVAAFLNEREAALAARPEPEGMETTAEERAAYVKAAETEFVWPEAGFVGRLLRDFDRLSADIASLKARVATAEAEKAETRKILVRCHDRIHALPRTSDTDLAIAIERLLGRLARGGRHEG